MAREPDATGEPLEPREPPPVDLVDQPAAVALDGVEVVVEVGGPVQHHAREAGGAVPHTGLLQQPRHGMPVSSAVVSISPEGLLMTHLICQKYRKYGILLS